MAASLGLAATLVVASATPSWAAIGARAQGSTNARVGTWSMDARTANDVTTPPLYTPLTVSGLSTKNILYFSLANLGSVSLISASFDITVKKGNSSPTVTFSACIGGTWNETSDVCQGGTTTTLFPGGVPAPGLNGLTSTVIPTAPLTVLRIQASSTLPGTTVTVSVKVSSPTDVRATRTVSA